MDHRTMGNRKGAAMVELAMILPILLVVLFGIIEFGFILYNKAVITNSSREGARAGIVYRVNVSTGDYQPHTVAEIQGKVSDYLDDPDNPDEWDRLIPHTAPTITVPDGICSEFPENPRPFLSVKVEYTYPFFILPALVTSITGPVTIKGESIMRCE